MYILNNEYDTRKEICDQLYQIFFFHRFIGCSSRDIQYKFIIQHTKKEKKRSKNPKGVGATGLTSHASHRP